jgi:hypothetical protein
MQIARQAGSQVKSMLGWRLRRSKSEDRAGPPAVGAKNFTFNNGYNKK